MIFEQFSGNLDLLGFGGQECYGLKSIIDNVFLQILFIIVDFEIGNIFNLIIKTMLSTLATILLIFINELYYINKQ